MSDSSTLTFLGAAGTVTGSKHLVNWKGHSFLLDCGLFQGLKNLRLRNWDRSPVEPKRLAAVVLSHAHIDHSGYLPLLVRQGFRGPIYCTSGTADLLHIMLPDAAHLQEEEAEWANRMGYSKHRPALPLYTARDAEAALRQLETRGYGKVFDVVNGVRAVFRRTGHILGSASIDLQLGKKSWTNLVFSGDLGRWDRPILRDPELVSDAEILLVECTYGDRVHPKDPDQQLARVVNESANRGGALLVPAFAVGRTQELLWRLRNLEQAGTIPTLPVFVDSPMAIAVTDVYCRHPEDHDLEMAELTDTERCPLHTSRLQLTRTPQESRALNHHAGPLIIIAGSGMATGGRILHHLKLRLPDPRTTVLLPGFQAAGTRGRSLRDGATEVRMQGQQVPVRATVEVLDGLSGHADREELMRWLGGFQRPPIMTYLVHGEPTAAQSFEELIKSRLGWPVKVAAEGEVVSLDL